MPLTKLQFRPGINREVTAYTNEGGWTDGDKIRFRAGSPETIGGWVKRSNDTFVGVARGLINWTTLTGANLLGIGTHLKYFIDRGGLLNDVTPIRLTTAAGAATFAATDGSDVLVVSNTTHGARINDFVAFSGAVSLGGNVTAVVLNAEFQITSVVDVDSYEITLSVTANASDTGNGGAGTIAAYQINVGLAISFRGDGWGADGWGAGGWGDPADTSIPGERLRLWSHTTFGEDLIINPRGEGIFLFDTSAGFTTRAVNVPTLAGANEVPVEVNIVRLSEQDRHVIAFGCTPLGGGDLDPLLIRFSTQESFLVWNPLATNTAGDLRISSGNQITAVEQTSQQMVILTDASVHTMQFVGPPFTFGIREVASGVSAAGPNCAIAVNDTVYWMGLGAFYLYNGVVQEIPCSVKEFVFDLTFDAEQRDVVFAGHNSAFSEVWWFYPAKAGGGQRYVIYNYAQELWYYGTLPRTVWVDRGTSLNPIAADLDGFLYDHESGLNDGSTDPATPLDAFIQSTPVDLGDGEQFMFASRMIPDLTFRSSTGSPVATITLTAQNFPGGAFFGDQPSPVARSVSVPVEQFTTQNFVRLRGRAAALRIESNQVGTQWRLGSPRLDLRTDGRR